MQPHLWMIKPAIQEPFPVLASLRTRNTHDDFWIWMPGDGSGQLARPERVHTRSFYSF